MKPITLSNEELQAILDGRKTQMRLVVEPQPQQRGPYPENLALWRYIWHWHIESWGDAERPPSSLCERCPYGQPGDKLSVFMPRWASPIALKITDVRVERVQDITGADALAEGPTRRELFNYHDNERMWFRRLWDSINAERGYPWDDNPWVWVIEFEVAQ